MKEVYLDGTKIEANASRYSFVWGKSIKTNKKRIENQLEELWKYACGVAREEMKDTEPLHFEQIDPEAVRGAIEKIDQALKDKDIDKKVTQKINYAKKNWPENLKRYEDQEKILGKHNNYSKTDPDASFMRMEGFKTHYDEMPDVLVADAGYGSEENYEYLEKEQVEAFVKFSYFHLEQYERLYTLYQASNCQGCPMRGACNDQKSNRVISINHKLRTYKEQARQRLSSELGIAHNLAKMVN